MQEAALALMAGDLATARRRLDAEPLSGARWLNLGLVELAEENYDGALLCFAQAREQELMDRSRLATGLALLLRGDYAAGGAALREAKGVGRGVAWMAGMVTERLQRQPAGDWVHAAPWHLLAPAHGAPLPVHVLLHPGAPTLSGAAARLAALGLPVTVYGHGDRPAALEPALTYQRLDDALALGEAPSAGLVVTGAPALLWDLARREDCVPVLLAADEFAPPGPEGGSHRRFVAGAVALAAAIWSDRPDLPELAGRAVSALPSGPDLLSALGRALWHGLWARPVQPVEPAQTVSLMLIARNEQGQIWRCLESVKGLVDEIVVVDTGSEDATPDLARAYGARLFHLPWSGDFSAARNYCHQQCRGGWLLWLDADEELLPSDGASDPLRDLVRRNPSAAAFQFTLYNLADTGPSAVQGALRQPAFRLFRNVPGFQFAGRIHEGCLESLAGQGPHVSTGVTVLHYGYLPHVQSLQGKAERNLALLEAAAAANPHDGAMQFYLGMERFRRADYRAAAACFIDARDRLAPVAARYPQMLNQLYKRLADALRQESRPQDALEALHAAQALYDDDSELWLLEALAWHQMGNWEAALAAVSTCRRKGPPGPGYVASAGAHTHHADFVEGLVREAQGELEHAVHHYESALAGWPGYGEAALRLGYCRLKAGQPAPAAEALTRAGDQPEVQRLLAVARWAAGDTRGATAAARRLTETQPDQAGALLAALAPGGGQAPAAEAVYDLMGHLLDLRQLDLAEQILPLALQADPGGAWAALGRLFCRHGLKEPAVDCLVAAAQQGQAGAPEYTLLGALAEEAGMRADARSFYAAAVQMAPHEAAHYVELARLLMEDGQPAEAAAILEQAVALTGKTGPGQGAGKEGAGG